jgi:trigger factor
MNIQKNDLGQLISSISVTLEPADYLKKYDQELQRLAAKAAVKGFRKGKTPVSVIKKMYGPSVFADMIDNLFNNALQEYLESEKIRFIAQPMLSAEQERLALEPANSDKSYTITYEIGELPPYTIKGISADDKYEYLLPLPGENYMEEELTYLARRLGKLEEVEDVIGEELIYVTASEMENGQVKEGGFSKDVILFFNSIEDQSLKDILMTKKLGDVFDIEVGKLENKDFSFIKKNLFGLPEEYDLKAEDVFQYKINKISRLKPAELTDELIKEQFQLESMDDLKKEVEKSFYQSQKPNADALLKKAVMDRVLDQTDMQVSEAFVRKWLANVEKLDQEKIEAELPKFVDELKWTYIKDEIARNFDIQVGEEDIRQVASNRIRSYEMNYGRIPQDTVNKIVKNWYSDRTELFKLSEEAKANKIFDKLFTIIQKEEKKLPTAEYEALFLANEQKEA